MVLFIYFYIFARGFTWLDVFMKKTGRCYGFIYLFYIFAKGFTWLDVLDFSPVIMLLCSWFHINSLCFKFSF